MKIGKCFSQRGERLDGKKVKAMDKFDILEEKINLLVDAYSALRREKDSLGDRLAEKESEIYQLNERINQFSRERDMAREKVEGLLNRVERLIASPAGIGKG